MTSFHYHFRHHVIFEANVLFDKHFGKFIRGKSEPFFHVCDELQKISIEQDRLDMALAVSVDTNNK